MLRFLRIVLFVLLTVIWIDPGSAQTTSPTSPTPSTPLIRPTEMTPQSFTYDQLSIGVSIEWVRTLEVGTPVSIMAVSPNGEMLATLTDGGNVAVRNPASGNLIEEHELSKRYDTLCMCFSPDSRWLLVGGEFRADYGFAILFDTKNWKARFIERSHPITSLGFAPDGKTFYTVSEIGKVAVWDTQNCHKPRFTIDAYEQKNRRAPLAVTFGPESDRLIVLVGPEKSKKEEAARNRIVAHSSVTGVKLSVVDFRPLTEWDGRQQPNLLALPNGDLVAYGDHLMIVRKASGELYEKKLAAKPNSIAFAYGMRGVIGYSDGLVELFELDSEGPPGLQPAHTGEITVVTLTSDGTTLFSGGRDGRVKVWRVK